MGVGSKQQKDFYRDMAFGYKVPLMDAIAIVSQFFEKDRETGIKIIKKLVPTDKSRKDFLLLNVC